MLIRELQWRGVPSWPPEFATSSQIFGEEAILRDVLLRNDQKIKLISVTAEHHGSEKKGIIMLENPVHLEILYQKLKENIGKPLREIGDLEIDFCPSIQKKGPKQVRTQTTAYPTVKKSQTNGA
jgi:hypothetical protein